MDSKDEAFVRICEANAELGKKLVEMIAADPYSNLAAYERRKAEEEIEQIRKLLDAEKVCTLAEVGDRKLTVLERVEALCASNHEQRARLSGERGPG
jgi:hypothetical protein